MSKKSEKLSLAGRYAAAFLNLAAEQEKLDVVANDLAALKKMIGSSADLARVTLSPVLHKADVEKALTVLAEKAKFSDLTIKFIHAVAENRRLAILPEIADAFLELLAKRRNEIAAEVITAAPLAANENAKLANILTKISGKKVRIAGREDKNILGGFKVQLGSRMIDASIAGKLERLKINLEKGI